MQRAQVIITLREHLAEVEKTSPEEVASLEYKFIEEAYAAGFDCFVAGWPTTRNSKGRCESPAVHNSSYKHYLGCREEEMLCNPTLFGDGLCIPFKTSAQKNSAFSQCEKAYDKDGRLFSEVLEMSSPQEFDELISTVYQSCHVKKDSGAMCQKLKRKLQHFVPDEVPQNYGQAQSQLKGADPEKMLKAAKKLQSEMEGDYNEFKRVCDPQASVDNKLYCKNLALRVKKSNELLPKLFSAVESKVSATDCVNCSHSNQKDVLDGAALPDLSSAKKLTCTEEQKKTNRQNCDKDIYCSIGSTIFSTALPIAEALGHKPNKCISSQNDCVTNLISALVDSLVSMVTGLWDLLGMFTNWAGEKLGDFWDYVRGVEDKTSNSQHILNKMSEADKKEVKTNPIQWVTNLAKNIWEGIKTWLKEDTFCEKWSGIPRASQCVQPATSFECLSCRTMIAGTCSASGVILAEVLPAFFTGGTVNVAARAGTGAKAVAAAIKASKAYKKVALAVDKLSDIRAIKLAAQGAKTTALVVKSATKPVYTATKASLKKVSSGYKGLIATKSFQATSKVIDQAAKYSGFKFVNKVMDDFYEAGFRAVDDVAGESVKRQKIVTKIQATQAAVEESRKAIDPLFNKVNEAYNIGHKIDDLNDEMRRLLLKQDVLSPETIASVSKDIETKIAAAGQEIAAINKDFVHDLHKIYEKEGIYSKIVTTVDKQTGVTKYGLELDFTQKASTNTAFEFYKRASSRFELNKVTVNLEDAASSSALGFFQPSTLRMEVGPNQGLQLLEEYVNSTGRHELRHAMFMAKRSRGDDSIFHLRYHASPGGKHLLNENRMYDGYMSAEELYTFSTDLQTLSQVFKGEMVTDLKKREGIINQIYNKNRGLKIISETNRQMAASMLESLNDIQKGSHSIGTYELFQAKHGLSLQLKDKLGRVSVMEFVSDEEMKLFTEGVEVYQEISKSKNAYVDKMLRERGIDPGDLIARAKEGKMTGGEKGYVTFLSEEFSKTAEAADLQKKMDKAMAPVLNKAKLEFEQLQKLSSAQFESVNKTETMLKQYAQSGDPKDLAGLRKQLVVTGKNVKEDYKGFATGAGGGEAEIIH